MFCKYCGRELPDGVKFCVGCGKPTSQASASPSDFKKPDSAPPAKKKRKKKKAMIALGIAVPVLVIAAIVIAIMIGKRSMDSVIDEKKQAVLDMMEEEASGEDGKEEAGGEDGEEEPDDNAGDAAGDDNVNQSATDDSDIVNNEDAGPELLEQETSEEDPFAAAQNDSGNDSENEVAEETEDETDDSPEEDAEDDPFTGNSQDFVFPESDTRELTESEVESMLEESDDPEWDLRIAINELYARHGRKFETDEIREYFENMDWYEGTVDADDFDNHQGQYLSEVEIHNRDLLTKYR